MAAFSNTRSEQEHLLKTIVSDLEITLGRQMKEFLSEGDWKEYVRIADYPLHYGVNQIQKTSENLALGCEMLTRDRLDFIQIRDLFIPNVFAKASQAFENIVYGFDPDEPKLNLITEPRFSAMIEEWGWGPTPAFRISFEFQYGWKEKMVFSDMVRPGVTFEGLDPTVV